MNVKIGESIRKLRTERNMTQENLADFLGVSFQAVSKWEREDTYPDLSMIPIIASFFGVSTDYLLGIDKEDQEREIQKYIDAYSVLWQDAKYEQVLKNMKEAVKAYPGEYSLLVRYLNALIWCGSISNERALSIKNEAESIYERIIKYCTIDSIRIWAKKLMCKYYRFISNIAESGINYCDIEKILNEMPLMQNSRDYVACSLYPDGEQKDLTCKKAINEIAFLLSSVAKEVTADDKKIEKLIAVLSSLKQLFPDEDYGKSFINVVYLTAELGVLYKKAEEKNKAKHYFNESIRLADKFDNLPIQFVCSSELINGLVITKKDIPMSQAGSLTKRINKFIQK